MSVGPWRGGGVTLRKPWEDTTRTMRGLITYGESTSVLHAEGTAIGDPPLAVPRSPERVFMLNNPRTPGPPYQRPWLGLDSAQAWLPYQDCRFGIRQILAPDGVTVLYPGLPAGYTGRSGDPIGQSLSPFAYHMDAADLAAGRLQRRTGMLNTGTGGRKSYELEETSPPWTSPPDGRGETGTYVHFDRSLAMMVTAHEVARAQFRQDYVPEAMAFLQGINDWNAIGGPTPCATFVTRWEGIIAAFERRIPLALPHVTAPLYYLFDGHPSEVRGNFNPSCLAWGIIADRDTTGRRLFVNASYALPHNSRDTGADPALPEDALGNAHRTARGVAAQGEMFGRHLDAAQRGSPLPRCKVIAWSLSGNVVTLTANRPLTVDTSRFPDPSSTGGTPNNPTGAPGTLGFTTEPGSGCTVLAVTVAGPEIKVVLSAPPSGLWGVGYAIRHPLGPALSGDRSAAWTNGETDMAGLAARTPGSWGVVRAAGAGIALTFAEGFVWHDWLEAGMWGPAAEGLAP